MLPDKEAMRKIGKELWPDVSERFWEFIGSAVDVATAEERLAAAAVQRNQRLRQVFAPKPRIGGA